MVLLSRFPIYQSILRDVQIMLDSCKIIGIYVYISFDVEILVGEYELNAFSSFLGTFTDDSATLS